MILAVANVLMIYISFLMEWISAEFKCTNSCHEQFGPCRISNDKLVEGERPDSKRPLQRTRVAHPGTRPERWVSWKASTWRRHPLAEEGLLVLIIQQRFCTCDPYVHWPLGPRTHSALTVLTQHIYLCLYLSPHSLPSQPSAGCPPPPILLKIVLATVAFWGLRSCFFCCCCFLMARGSAVTSQVTWSL